MKQIQVTPAFCKMVLAKANPLLANAAAVDSDWASQISISLTPADMVLPSHKYNVRMEPLKLVRRFHILDYQRYCAIVPLLYEVVFNEFTSTRII